MDLFTIGFTKKTAEKFFSLLMSHGVRRILDIRRNNTSIYSGFAKIPDLPFFLLKIGGIGYHYWENFAPSKELLQEKLPFQDYAPRYMAEITARPLWNSLDLNLLDQGCLLCAEATPDECHRRLLAEALQKRYIELNLRVIHLVN
jgi:uncharacterized protein (DUF488 family)